MALDETMVPEGTETQVAPQGEEATLPTAQAQAGGDIEADKAEFLRGVQSKISALMAMKGKKNSTELRTRLIEVLKQKLSELGISPSDPASMAKAEELIGNLPPDVLAILSGTEGDEEAEAGSPLKEKLASMPSPGVEGAPMSDEVSEEAPEVPPVV